MTPTTPSAEALAAALKREIAAKSTSTVAELVSPLIDQLAVTAIADATSDPLLKKIAHLTHCWEHMRWCKETSDAIEDLIAATASLEAEPKAQAQAAESSSQVHGADTQAAKDAGRAASGFVKRHQAMMKAAQDVLAERERQVGAEGWTPEHDEEHDRGELCAAGAAYALAASDRLHPLSQGDGDYAADNPPLMWPHGWTFKPADPRRMLVKAAALILAEIECLDRGSCAADRADWRMRVAAIAAECTDPDAQAALDKLLEDSL